MHDLKGTGKGKFGIMAIEEPNQSHGTSDTHLTMWVPVQSNNLRHAVLSACGILITRKHSGN